MRVEQFTEDDARRRAELPDIDPDKDLELTVADGMLHIRPPRGEDRDPGEGVLPTRVPLRVLRP